MTELKVSQELIACTLPEEKLPGHLDFIRREVLDKAIRVEESTEGYALYFSNEPAMRRTLEELIAFEADCCASLSLELAEVDGRLSLQISGPAGTKEVLDEALSLEERVGCSCCGMSKQNVQFSRWKRWGKSGAVVAVASIVVCELPLLLLALGLGGAAMSVDALGEIWEIAAVAAVSVPLLYWVWRRRT